MKAKGKVFRKNLLIRTNVLGGQNKKAEKGLLDLAVGKTLVTFEDIF